MQDHQDHKTGDLFLGFGPLTLRLKYFTVRKHKPIGELRRAANQIIAWRSLEESDRFPEMDSYCEKRAMYAEDVARAFYRKPLRGAPQAPSLRGNPQGTEATP